MSDPQSTSGRESAADRAVRTSPTTASTDAPLPDTHGPVAASSASSGSPSTDQSSALAPRRLRLCLAVAVVALALDIVSKIIIVATLSDRDPLRLLGGALYLTEARNPGAAWGLGAGTAAATVLFTGVAAVVVVVIVRAARRLHSIGWAVAFGLVLGGALGNLTDRLMRDPGIGRGHVVDWISVFAGDGSVFPIFNAADSAITCGAALAVLMALRGIEFDGRRTKDVEAQKAAHAAAPKPDRTPDQIAEETVADPAPLKGAAPSADESAEAPA